VTRAWRAAATTLCVAIALTGCVKSTTFNPYAPPDNKELDRLQTVVNDQADLEPTKQALLELDTKIRAAIAEHSPHTVLATYGIDASEGSCVEPYTWTIGTQYNSAHVSGKPAPDAQQWQRIVDEITPEFAQAGFHESANTAAGRVSQSNGEAFVELTNGSGGSPLMYKFSTGCRMPTAWRTSPPPPGTDSHDAEIHYPYLFGSPGGRTVAPG
jgi:hypothetical protein